MDIRDVVAVGAHGANDRIAKGLERVHEVVEDVPRPFIKTEGEL